MKTSSISNILIASLAVVLTQSCNQERGMEITVVNPCNYAREGEMVEVNANSVLNALGSSYIYVTDSLLNEIPSQITYDGKLIFRASVTPDAQSTYYIYPSDSVHSYDTIAVGRIYPERADDIAWENEYVGFRAYGPGTQSKGEKAFGYDIFFKHPSDEPILERLYAPEISPVTWQKVDSLRAIDPTLAEEYIKTFSYHIDHGLGMDCYAVGPTLGAGVAAIVDNDTICFPWCYRDAEILDNGPLRFTVKLTFSPTKIGSDSMVTEHRTISLDAGSHLNRCLVSYEGLSNRREFVVGFPIRDESRAIVGNDQSTLVYSDPTQGTDNGKAMLGVIVDGETNYKENENHHLLHGNIAPDDTLAYYWGFAWDRADIKSQAEWVDYVNVRKENIAQPLKVSYKPVHIR